MMAGMVDRQTAVRILKASRISWLRDLGRTAGSRNRYSRCGCGLCCFKYSAVFTDRDGESERERERSQDLVGRCSLLKHKTEGCATKANRCHRHHHTRGHRTHSPRLVISFFIIQQHLDSILLVATAGSNGCSSRGKNILDADGKDQMPMA